MAFIGILFKVIYLYCLEVKKFFRKLLAENKISKLLKIGKATMFYYYIKFILVCVLRLSRDY